MWRTMAITVAVALTCSAMVSVAVHLLRPLQALYAAAERNQVILGLADGLPAQMDDVSLGQAFLQLDARVVELASGAFVDTFDADTFEHWQPGEDGSAAVSSAAAIGLQRLPRFAPVYRVLGEDGQVQRTILPIYGQGMWSTLYGYVALGPDLLRIDGLAVYRHGETPGIGDRIAEPQWLAGWRGKFLYDAQGELRLQVSADAAQPVAHRVDAISGATVTSVALGRIVAFLVGGGRVWPLFTTGRGTRRCPMKFIQRVRQPLIEENPVTVQILGLCSALAVSRTLEPALIMAASVVAVLVFSNLIVSLLRHWLPHSVRLILEVTIVASAVVVVDELIKTFAPHISEVLSVFVGLIITNCIILGRAESFAMQHRPAGERRRRARQWRGLCRDPVGGGGGTRAGGNRCIAGLSVAAHAGRRRLVSSQRNDAARPKRFFF